MLSLARGSTPPVHTTLRLVDHASTSAGNSNRDSGRRAPVSGCASGPSQGRRLFRRWCRGRRHRVEQYLRVSRRHDVDAERRRLLKYGTAGIVSATLGGINLLGLQSGSSGSSDDHGLDVGHLSDRVGPCFNNSPLGPRFIQPLFIPPAVPPTRVDGTDDIYDIWESRGETVIATVPAGRKPFGVDVSVTVGEPRVWVTSFGTNTVSVIDARQPI